MWHPAFGGTRESLSQTGFPCHAFPTGGAISSSSACLWSAEAKLQLSSPGAELPCSTIRLISSKSSSLSLPPKSVPRGQDQEPGGLSQSRRARKVRSGGHGRFGVLWNLSASIYGHLRFHLSRYRAPGPCGSAAENGGRAAPCDFSWSPRERSS